MIQVFLFFLSDAITASGLFPFPDTSAGETKGNIFNLT